VKTYVVTIEVRIEIAAAGAQQAVEQAQEVAGKVEHCVAVRPVRVVEKINGNA